LWQGRFHSTALDEKHLWLCLRYIEQNPINAGIVARAQDYIWSSAACHCGMRDDSVLTPRTRFCGAINDWESVLTETLTVEDIALLKRRTHSGLPCGDRKFLKRMSKKVGYELIERKKGRPKKTDKAR